MLVHCHKTLADTIDPAAIAKMFVSANEQRKEHFGKFKKRRLKRNDYGQLIDRSLIPKVNVFFFLHAYFCGYCLPSGSVATLSCRSAYVRKSVSR